MPYGAFRQKLWIFVCAATINDGSGLPGIRGCRRTMLITRRNAGWQ